MNENNSFFPMFVDLKDRKIKVFGAGKIASRRIKTLLSFEADITVIAPFANETVLGLSKEKLISYEERPYKKGELKDEFFVLAATDNLSVNDDIYKECKEKNIIINVSSDFLKCDFHFPGIARKNNIVIGINAGGKDHKGAKEYTKKIKSFLQEEKE
ncbi:precorrin-2 dehydrogenase / sirohydrochlorin ferrochelatase/precorrin-6A/cobalt-precorrin-6A reductase [Acetitomaculum ruminis DSM 5522]|uniref:precorrin-2 dehydrogenase n=1 Tax=Acetitomaculum ruminis DSM 5522 TaxID=1120918 RepID=A0A1I0YY50_9FIRM|nr:bifunctional precorrin-2 dehydrogenase/sirohydrochlorin ferrochelatase [Acetitomaculum ruminis]SFB18201.1 precorrin-2 dehydrogenase / sirohydrochlorin ferrochelatase/precorrin-6A/cobalt-precorrin-6A reductase [Acetitomaculum ruminis DSM 5522]